MAAALGLCASKAPGKAVLGVSDVLLEGNTDDKRTPSGDEGSGILLLGEGLRFQLMAVGVM